jgi:MFS family permease
VGAEENSGAGAQVPEEITGQPRRVLVGSVVLRRTFSALKHRNFRLFFYGQMVSLMGTWMQNTALSWLVYKMTGSKLLLGLVSASSSAPMLFLSIYGGSVADRHSKRNVLLWTQSCMMVFAFALTGLSASGLLTPGLIVLMSALGGMAMAFDMPTRQSFLVEITNRNDLHNAISLNSAIVNGARVVGPAVAGFIMAHTGASVCFFLNALSFLAVIGGLLLMQIPKHHREVHAKKPGHIRESFRYVLQNRRLRIVFSLFAVVGIFGWSYSILLPAFARDILNLEERGYGTLLGANGVGALCGALTTAAFGSTFKPRHLAFVGLYVFSGMLLVLAVFPNYVMSLICLCVAGWGMMMFFSTINTVIQTSVPDELRGRVMGIWALVFGGMMPLGSLQAGTLSQWLGVLATVEVGATICALAGIITWLVIRKNDPSPPNNQP